MAVAQAALRPLRATGEFFTMAFETAVVASTSRLAWREALHQMWFVARVSILPTLLLSIPFMVLTVFMLNILLIEFGATDFSGVGASFTAVTQIGPIVTVLVVAGAGATAMCADLGARTIREELDALRVLGVNITQALVVPRVLAATLVAVLLSSAVSVVGLVGAYLFVVYVQHVNPGAFVASLTLLVGLPEVAVALAKSALFGLSASLIACFKGTTVDGGPSGVGNAVNETVVYSFIALFFINVIATAVGVKVTA